jgi:phosphoglycolate phosphatase
MMRMAAVRYGLAIFDFDGTLCDSFPWFAEVFGEVAEKFGLRKIDAAEGDALRACGPREVMRRLAVPSWKVPLIANHMRGLKAAHADRISLFPGVRELLLRLSGKGVTLAIVSSDAESNVRRLLGPENAALIAHYACRASLFGKQARLLRVLRRSGVPAAASIYIGDELRDAEAARAANIAFGAVSWGYAKIEALRAHQPSELFASLEEIAERVG